MDGRGVHSPKRGHKVPRRSGMDCGAFGFLNDLIHCQSMACDCAACDMVVVGGQISIYTPILIVDIIHFLCSV
jgi:hypothetical protein